jgi:hypothetical protein
MTLYGFGVLGTESFGLLANRVMQQQYGLEAQIVRMTTGSARRQTRRCVKR